MNNRSTTLTTILLMLGCFAIPRSFGVVPAPDGGYPGGNTAEGQNALFSLTTGGFNTAVGFYSLRSNTLGNFNTAIGAGALFANVGDPNLGQGGGNTATGAGALLSNSTGSTNTANGAFALSNNTEGNYNTATGGSALFRNTTGYQNTAYGAGVLQNSTTGHDNTAHGFFALSNNISGSFNTALGYQAGNGIVAADNVIAIQHPGVDLNNSCWIGNIYGVSTQSSTTAQVIVSDTGQLGTVASSLRFKKDIAAMDKTSEAILSLKPVTFHYKSDAKETPQFGLIAEEVAKVNPALVLPDKEGKPYTVKYDAVNAMLLNEFLKQHRKVEDLEAKMAKQQKDFQATATHQQKQIEALTAGLQKVSAQLEMSKAIPNVVLNGP